VELSPVIAVGVTPKLIGVGLGDSVVPGVLFHESYCTVEFPRNAALGMPGCQALVGAAGAVVEVAEVILVRLPEDDAERRHAAQFDRRIDVQIIAVDRSVHDVSGALLVPLVESGAEFVAGAEIHVAALQTRPQCAGAGVELGGSGSLGIDGVKPALAVRGVAGPPVGPGQVILIVVPVHRQGQDYLSQIIDIHRAHGLIFGIAQRRQQQRGENADDGDDHQQLNQGESCSLHTLSARPRQE
jgi:hypothetical protein